MSHVLLVDDEPSICWGLEQLCKRLGHQTTVASRAEAALDLAKQETFDVILLDVRLPGMSGIDALPQLKTTAPHTPVVVMTAFGDLETAVEAVRNGAAEYLVKPFDTTKVTETLHRLLRPRVTTAPALAPSPNGIVGRTPAMQEVFRRVALAAASDACVLVSGESGSGKELIARAVHRYSLRADKPFVAVNLAAINPSLAESELFGHVRGAFTGADAPRIGLLAQAHGGTLFLDEVADIPLPVQVKLLRALEHGEVTPVGSGQSVPAQFRLVSATHRSLPRLVREGSFRHDLFYRLTTFQIELPPLRERRDDIPLLIEFFVRRLGGENKSSEGSPRVSVSPEALKAAAECSWHGNVRELRNAVEHALVLARDGHIQPEHWPPPMPKLDAAGPLDQALDETELDTRIAELLTRWAGRQLTTESELNDLYERLLSLVEPPVLEATLKRHRQQCAAAARVLGLHRTTLRKRLDQFGLKGEE